MAAPSPGSFEYLEAKIRRDAEGTLFGRDFEWVCQWYLEHAPLYRGKFRRVWRWAEWPDRWGRDCGIDLVAETQDGKLWAIQAKAVSPHHSITKAEIDSFLAESNRLQIAYRLLIGTTDNIGTNARRTIDEQAKHASVLLRGDLVSADIAWPERVGGVAPTPKRAKPRPHQRKAISDVFRGFRKHDRGRLIMACGTGKTLTGLWIHERLKSRRTLLLVPSISLVQQNLREWGRHARKDFDFLVVCSDESVASNRDDPALRYIAELGIDVTTDAKDIAAFLAKRPRRPAVVIATYQSSDRVSAGQRRAKKIFDLALCDEAHRLVGHIDGKFATILDDRRIRARRRLFMTATPRYFTQRARDRAADQDLELASMDDAALFGPEFHVLKFSDAINAKPTPLLTDYRVVVIGVTNAEAAAWVKEGRLVRTKENAETDSRTLAAQIGLAKAMGEYDLRRVITFHRSIRRASRFVDDGRKDSLPAVVAKMRPGSRPTGRLWARHISGETPASKRASMLRALAELPPNTRGLVSNCACLGEGVDVPALDGIAFIDPKGSVVDIIQAVGRVIRLSPDKTIGTIVIPVFIDESADADHALEQSAFAAVWQVLKALRAHDRRLADELDQLRMSLGRQTAATRCIQLPPNIVFDVPRMLLRDFEQAFYVRTVERATERPPLTVEQILAWADEHKNRTGSWPKTTSGNIPGTNETWTAVGSALWFGNRGLDGTRSLAQLLERYRGVRNLASLPDRTVHQILTWADSHKSLTGQWPTATTGRVSGTDESWARIDNALQQGQRGLPPGSSLARLLHKHRGVRNKKALPSLTVAQVLCWADAYRDRHGSWPTKHSGVIIGAEEKWSAVITAANEGLRGLPKGTSWANLLAKHRGYRNPRTLKPLSLRRILQWADEFHRRNGEWPNRRSGEIPGTNETWSLIETALSQGQRSLPGGNSLAQVLATKRDKRNRMRLPPLTTKQIIRWAKRHRAATGAWPTVNSGAIEGTAETWQTIAGAIARGRRGLDKHSGLAGFLEAHVGHRNMKNLPRLSISQILEWADAYHAENAQWPTRLSGEIPDTPDTWLSIDSAIRRASRGLRGKSSLPRLLANKRGVKPRLNARPLSLDQVVALARKWHQRTGKWPNRQSGEIDSSGENWASIDSALRNGSRGLPGGSSITDMLVQHCGVRDSKHLPALSISQVVKWATEFHAKRGQWPTREDGAVFDTGETWGGIDAALRRGSRGIGKKTSLPRLRDTAGISAR